jgi:hypothetical protein
LSSEDSITTPGGAAGRDGLQVEHFGLQQDRVEQIVDASAGLGGQFDHLRVATEVFGHDLLGQQLVLDAQRVGIRLVDLVDGDDQRHLRRLRVLHGFARLRHHAVVGGHDQHHDVGELGAARTHLRERRVARGIEEADDALRRLDVVGADVLGDATGLRRRRPWCGGCSRAARSCRDRRGP